MMVERVCENLPRGVCPRAWISSLKTRRWFPLPTDNVGSGGEIPLKVSSSNPPGTETVRFDLWLRYKCEHEAVFEDVLVWFLSSL